MDPGEVLSEAQIATAAQISVRAGFVEANAIGPLDALLDITGSVSHERLSRRRCRRLCDYSSSPARSACAGTAGLSASFGTVAPDSWAASVAVVCSRVISARSARSA